MSQRALTIGREPSSDILVNSPYLSSVHAEITLVDAQSLTFAIKDLGSTNGTFINGERVDKGVFGFSDKVSLGAYQLESIDFIAYFLNIDESSLAVPRGFGRGLGMALTVGGLFIVLGLVGLAYFYPRGISAVLASATLMLAMTFLVLEMLSGFRRKQAEDAYFAFKKQRLSTWLEQQRLSLERQTMLDEHAWQGYRKFKVLDKVQENSEITSFYLSPHDGKGIPRFYPGQFLTIRLSIPGQERPAVRCYSLSCGPNSEYYRVSIKRIGAAGPDLPQGLGSSYMHDSVQVGDFVDLKSPSGSFYLDIEKTKASVLLAGGIGITPMLSMLDVLVEAQVTHPVWLFYGVRDQGELTQIQHIRSLASSHKNIKVCICFSKPKDGDVLGRDFDHVGRVDLTLLKEKLGSSNYQFFLCGPGAFMEDLNSSLEQWGVPEDDIYLEAFGPSSVKKKEASNADAKNVSLQFKKSGKKVSASNQLSLLEIAEGEGVSMDFGCRAGSCGSCEVAIVDGEVSYDQDVDFPISEGCCLACVARPTDNLIIDA